MGVTNDVVISITRDTKRIQEVGFGLPLILGEGGVFSRLDIGIGEAGLRWVSDARGEVYIDVRYLTPSAQVPTSGSHKWGFAAAKTAASASGLANDVTAFTATVAVDGGVAQAISIVGSASQTLQTVIDEINVDLTGATVAWEASGNGYIKITSDTTGTSSSVRIVDTDLFASLTDANVTSEVAEDGLADVTSLSVVLTGAGTVGDPHLITVNLDTDATDAIVTTARQIKTVAEANSSVAAIVKVLLQGSTGSGVVAAAASDSLAEPADRYTEYSDMLGVVYDGFSSGDDVYDMTAAMLSQSPSPSLVAVYARDTGAAINTVLDGLRLQHDTWYALAINNRTKDEILIAAEYVNLNSKLGVFACTDDTILDSSTEDRAAIIIHDAAGDYPDCAWLGICLPKNPGAITWKWKKPNGQSSQGYSTTKLNSIAARNGNWLEDFGGVVVFKEGITSGGEFIDVIRGMDWVEQRMIDSITMLLINSDKIAMDNDGIPRIESKVREVLGEAAARGIIAAATTEAEQEKSDDNLYMYTVTAPLRADVPDADRAARNLTGIEWEYTLAGAVHKVDPIRGRIGA